MGFDSPSWNEFNLFNLIPKIMVQESFYSTTLKSVVKRIDKRVAEKMFNQGKIIYLQSSNMMFDNIWQSPMETSLKECEENLTFDYICGFFIHFNCDSERGKYIKFYIKEK